MRALRMLCLCLVLWAAPASADPKNSWQSIFSLTTVEFGTPLLVTITNPNHDTGYLVIKAENEVGDATLQMKAYIVSVDGAILQIMPATTMTANGTYAALLGSTVTAGEGVNWAFDFPWTQRVIFQFDCITTPATSFDVTAGFVWLAD